MKRTIACILATLMLLSVFSAASGQVADDGSVIIRAIEPVEDTIGIQRGTELIVGSTTQLSGYFATDMWDINTANLDVRALLHGYSTIIWAGAQEIGVDPTVVRNIKAQNQADGSRTYTITLSEELCYNDGTPITAKDYLFSLLLTGSGEVTKIGGTPNNADHIIGYQAYRMGEQEQVSGLRLVSDYAYSITISAEYNNYFYALALLNATPYPIGVIAPGCDIFDDGSGVYIGESESAKDMDAAALGFTPGQFDAAMLERTLLDPETGYVFNPQVTSGPYSLESYDAEAHEARFVINERYAGNFEGQKPHIERLLFGPVENETMLEELKEGTVGLLNKVTPGTVIAEGMSLSREGGAQVSNYMRTGLAYLSFACEEGVMSSVLVRRAIAHTIDKPVYVASAIGNGNALPVYGYYGMGQWMLVQSFEADESGKGELVAMDELAALEVPYDLEEARKLLEKDGWTLNELGERFIPGTDDIRYRDEDGTLVPLVIRWAKIQDNMLADGTHRALEYPFSVLGISLEVTEMPFNQMLSHYYRQEERKYDMFYLASNFEYIFDPYYDYNTADEYQGLMNTTGLKDEELMNLAKEMRETAPGAIREYVEEWIAFQKRWVELMPMVPLYSNVYFDFYSNELRDYNIGQFTNWAYAIPYAWIGEEPQADEGENSLGEGDVPFGAAPVDEGVMFVP